MDFNVLIGNYWIPRDKELFFQDEKEFIEKPEDIGFPELLVDLGIFRSRSEAKKNGWNKEIPEGFTDISIGKLKHRVTILKCTEPSPYIDYNKRKYIEVDEKGEIIKLQKIKSGKL